MKIVDLQQGTPGWNAHRAKRRNASDTPSIMGLSPYELRDQAIARLATGEKKEFSDYTQKNIIDNGHVFERLARGVAEEIHGELYPCVAVSDCGKYSVSFDGVTIDDVTNWEHKSLNNEIREAKKTGVIPMVYRAQMQHGFIVNKNAELCCFHATKWAKDADGNDILEESIMMVEVPDLELQEKIHAAWEQAEKDIAAYVAPAAKPVVVAEAVEQLPVLFAQTKGELSVTHNIDAFKQRFDAYKSSIKTELFTDQDFADAKAHAKNLGDIEKRLITTADQLVAQNASVAEVVDFAKACAAEAARMRILLTKLHDSETAKRKQEKIQAAKDGYQDYADELIAELGFPLNVAAPNWVTAAANKRTMESLGNALNTALAQGKIDLEAAAKVVRKNLAHYKTAAAGYEMLFADLDAIAQKQHDDFVNLVSTRIAAHEAEIKRRAEAEAQRMVAEAQQRAEEAQRRAEEEAQAKAEAKWKADIEAQRLVDAQAATTALDSLVAPVEKAAEPVAAEAALQVAVKQPVVQVANAPQKSAAELAFDARSNQLLGLSSAEAKFAFNWFVAGWVDAKNEQQKVIK